MDANVPNRNASARLAALSTGCFCYFAFALVLMHVLRPDYTVVDHMISDYAVGRFGWIMTTAFGSASLGCLMLGLAMILGRAASWSGRVGAALLIVTAAGLLVTAIFPTDLETAPSTATGDIHALSFMVNILAVLLSALFLGLSYGGSRYWRSRRPVALGLFALLLVAFVAQVLTLHRGAPYGLTNRAFVIVLIAWFISTSLWLRRALVARS